MELNKSIIKIRVDLQSKKLKKSGKNAFQGFTYFELGDFLPTLNELMQQEGVNDLFTIKDDIVSLTLIKGKEREVYEIPYTQFPTPLNKNGSPSMQDIQYLGALITYYKRYLYLNAFGITDGEVIDAMEKVETPKKTTPKKPTKTEQHKREIWNKFNEDLKNENITVEEFLKFNNIKMTEKVKIGKFIEEYTSNDDLRNELVKQFKS